MSQGAGMSAGVFNLARAAYLRLLPPVDPSILLYTPFLGPLGYMGTLRSAGYCASPPEEASPDPTSHRAGILDFLKNLSPIAVKEVLLAAAQISNGVGVTAAVPASAVAAFVSAEPTSHGAGVFDFLQNLSPIVVVAALATILGAALVAGVISDVAIYDLAVAVNAFLASNLPEAATVVLAQYMGSIFLGPPGIFLGAAAGCAGVMWAEPFLKALTAIRIFIKPNPVLYLTVSIMIILLQLYLRQKGHEDLSLLEQER